MSQDLKKCKVKYKAGDDEIKIMDVLYSPSIKCNLLSVGFLTNIRRVLMFTATNVYILDNIYRSKVVAFGDQDNHNGLYNLYNLVTAWYQTSRLIIQR